ncbi:MAG: ImmA/IrrE family metallo-endopeptidase, partial [Chroococcales cyanobacterium]
LRGIEWQAQYFASCLLMPQDRLRSHSFNYNLTDWQHLYAMAEAFGVTISHLVYRLKDLGWIHIPEGTREIYLYDVQAIGFSAPQKAVANS